LVADAMRLPVPDARVDAVVIGLALCSIPRPELALEEVRRVLRPDGVLRFVEHVRDEEGTRRARVQDAINPAWRFVSGGCNCNRRTEQLVMDGGFRIAEIDRFKLGMPHVAPHVLAEARLS
jgi:SAM-dependent methyltransferase